MNALQLQYNIIEAQEDFHFEAGRHLFLAYQHHLNEDLCFQSFKSELLHLSEMYASLAGALLLVKAEDRFIGCVGLRIKEKGICEMKRLYVIEEYKGQGIGRQLVEAIIKKAKALGYHTMILDTLTKLKPALQLYHSAGFQEIPPYYANPLQDVVYMQKKLQ